MQTSRSSIIAILVLLLLVASLAGCSTNEQESMLIYERSGAPAGVTGVEQRLHVTAEGEAVLIRKRHNGAEERISFSVSDEQLQQMHALFADVDFAQLRNDYGEPAGAVQTTLDTRAGRRQYGALRIAGRGAQRCRPGADHLQYRVVYNGHTVQAADGTVPAELAPVIDRLNRIIKHSMTTNPVIVTRQTKP